MTTFTLNGRTVSAHSPNDAPLLWVIRDELGLTGTKFGCGQERVHNRSDRYATIELGLKKTWRRARDFEPSLEVLAPKAI